MAEHDSEQILRGIAASPGFCVGRAVVVTGLREARLNPDIEVLVVHSIHPEWIDVLVRVHAVVADVGGAMSHAATICRELGIPAVVGTTMATTRLRNGLLVSVNGTRGEVQALAEP